jgi:hypothetical protein
MDVAAANAAGVDAEHDFVVGGLRLGKVDVLEAGRSGEQQGFHVVRGS